MIGRRVYPRHAPPGPQPRTSVYYWHGWTSWTFGVAWERHPSEVHAVLHLGPVQLDVHRLAR